jgi:threonine aldolase
VGCLAAAARVALQETPSKLVDDNRRARELAQALAATAPLAVDVATVQSNLVYIHTGALPAAAVAAAVGEQGVRVLAVGPHTIRACCHHQIDDGRLRIAIDAFRHAVQQLQT